MQAIAGFSNFSVRVFNCPKDKLSDLRRDLAEKGWEILSEKTSSIYKDMIVKAKKKGYEYEEG